MLLMFEIAAVIVLAGAILYVGAALLRGRKARPQPTAKLRVMALHLTPGEAGIAAQPGLPFGVIMETTYERGAATLVALADGTASLYFSTGGGVIGGNTPASKRCVAVAAGLVAQLAPVSDDAFPPPGGTRFHLLTPEGRVGGGADEQTLAGGGHPLSPLFYAAQEVITQLRLATQHYNARP
jgi:hypothetical protein